MQSVITVIGGVVGAGKTSLGAAFGIDNMHGQTAREAVRNSRAMISTMNANGYNLTLPQKHLTFADFGLDYRSPDCGRRQSYDVDGFKLGFWTDKYLPQYLPPYSCIILDEAVKYFNSRRSQQFADNISRFWEQLRKFHLTAILIVQRVGLIDRNIRELARIIIVDNLRFKYNKYGEIAECIWYFHEWETYAQYEAGERGKRVTYIFKGNVFKYYNSYEGHLLYMQGLDKADFEYHVHEDYLMSPEDVVRYAERHKQLAPDGFYEKKLPTKQSANKAV